MSTVSRLGTFYCYGQIESLTGPGKCSNIVFPRFLVEIDSQEPAGFIAKKELYPDNV